MHASFSLLGDMCSTRQLGVPRDPRSGPQPYREVVMRRLDLGLTSLSSFRLSWEELGPAMRALIGGVALFAPLDSELEFDWLRGFDIKMAELCRQELRLGISARAPLYLPARYAGYPQPSAVRDCAIIPWCRELLVELNDPGSWGRVTRGLWDSLLAPAIARGRRPLAPAEQGVRPDGPPALAAAPPARDLVGRLFRKLAGYGVFIRDLHYKTHSRFMDLLAE